MPLLHVVVFRLRPDAAEGEVEALDEALSALPSLVPALRSYRHGRDLGLRDGNADYAVVAEVDDAEGLAAYLEHPAHVDAVRDHVTPLAVERHAVQISV